MKVFFNQTPKHVSQDFLFNFKKDSAVYFHSDLNDKRVAYRLTAIDDEQLEDNISISYVEVVSKLSSYYLLLINDKDNNEFLLEKDFDDLTSLYHFLNKHLKLID